MHDMETTMKKWEGTGLEIKADFHRKKPMGYDLRLGQEVEDQNESSRQVPCPDKNELVRMAQMKQAQLNFGPSRSKINVDNPSPQLLYFPVDTHNPPVNQSSSSVSIPRSVFITPKFDKPKQSQPPNQLTVLELRKRRENGLCLHCDEEKPVDNNFENQGLQVLVVIDDLEEVCFTEVEKGDGKKNGASEDEVSGVDWS
ncbi:uncharacterized protein LOC111411789 [Olea europaea var. sylvestris]|uniref:uncharacterized protein LOC111411789 n=1 Tax=Olea europaea var. sylvestris TaxID=158386 RepID=UPI000C1D3E3B|nr:uncharacterized protein LOC111411789 [Olea europaea var. sylvestris]